MILNKNNWEDGRKYYENTFAKLHSDKVDLGERIWRILSITPHELRAEDSNGEVVYADLSRDLHLKYVLPRKTVYQLGDNAAMLTRIPARQWFKGLHAKNTEILILSGNGNWSRINFNIKTIEGFVNKPSYYTFEDAVNNFEKGEALQSAALSSRIAITRMGGVYIDPVLVGKWSKDKLTIKKEFAKFVTPFISLKEKLL